MLTLHVKFSSLLNKKWPVPLLYQNVEDSSIPCLQVWNFLKTYNLYFGRDDDGGVDGVGGGGGGDDGDSGGGSGGGDSDDGGARDGSMF